MTGSGYLTGLLPHVEGALRKEARKLLYRSDPVLWAKDILHVDLWYKQEEVACSLADPLTRRVAVKAGHGVGKSYLAAVLACWWVDTHPIGSAFVASTAPSMAQVSAILWQEIRGFWMRSQALYKDFQRLKAEGRDTSGFPDHALPGTINGNNEWRTPLGVLLGQGRKPPDHNEDAFQGIHRQYVLAIGDEAVGLKEQMLESLENITTNDTSKILLIANPTNPATRLGYIFSGKINEKSGQPYGEGWAKHSISVLESPNFHGGGLCDCEEHVGMPIGLGLGPEALRALVGPRYVEDKKREYGEDSPRYCSRVIGEFAYDSGSNLFSEYALGRARDAACFVPDDSRRVLGVDVARSDSGDFTYIYLSESGLMYAWMEIEGEDGTRHDELGDVTDVEGARIRYVDSFRGIPFGDREENDGKGGIVKTIGQATFIHQHAVELGVSEVRVDAAGSGRGLVDALFSLRLNGPRPYVIIDMLGNNPSPDSNTWRNDRAFQYDRLRDRMENGIIDLDPGDALLLEQLADISFEEVAPRNAIKIESKEEMRKRGIKSPDAADACSYAAAILQDLSDPLQSAKSGDILYQDPFALLNEARFGEDTPWATDYPMIPA